MIDQRRTVLIVEDDAAVRAMLVRVLGASYKVSIADDGETALSRFESGERFDVVGAATQHSYSTSAVLSSSSS